MIRTIAELQRLETFEERFHYLSLAGQVGASTFGFDRYINQQFYRSSQWRRMRQDIIARDEGCDLGLPGYEIFDKIIIHHMNPMTVDDVVDGSESILDPNVLICVTHATHNAIHYGDINQLPRKFEPRKAGDTSLWGKH